MGTFEVKYRVGFEVRYAVIAASDEVAAGREFGAANRGISANDIISVRDLGASYQKEYGAAKFVGLLISFGGWIIFGLGILGVVGGFIGMGASSSELGLSPVVIKLASSLVIMFSLLYSVFGLFMAAMGQHFRATVDTANYNGEMLALMKLGKA